MKIKDLLLFIGNYVIIVLVRPTWHLIRLYMAHEPKWFWHPCLTSFPPPCRPLLSHHYIFSVAEREKKNPPYSPLSPFSPFSPGAASLPSLPSLPGRPAFPWTPGEPGTPGCPEQRLRGILLSSNWQETSTWRRRKRRYSSREDVLRESMDTFHLRDK